MSVVTSYAVKSRTLGSNIEVLLPGAPPAM